MSNLSDIKNEYPLTCFIEVDFFFKKHIVATSLMNAIPETGIIEGIKKKIKRGIGLAFSWEMQNSVMKEKGISIAGNIVKNEIVQAVTMHTTVTEKIWLDFSFKFLDLMVRNNLRADSAAIK
jgi:hypothetical protein